MADRIFASGNKLAVSFDTVDLSTLTQACDLDATRDAMELKRCGGAAVARLVGSVASTYKWKAWYDSIVYGAVTALMAADNPAPVELVVTNTDVSGATTTETSQVYVNKASRKSTPDKPVEMEVELLVDGEVAYA